MSNLENSEKMESDIVRALLAVPCTVDDEGKIFEKGKVIPIYINVNDRGTYKNTIQRALPDIYMPNFAEITQGNQLHSYLSFAGKNKSGTVVNSCEVLSFSPDVNEEFQDSVSLLLDDGRITTQGTGISLLISHDSETGKAVSFTDEQIAGLSRISFESFGNETVVLADSEKSLKLLEDNWKTECTRIETYLANEHGEDDFDPVKIYNNHNNRVRYCHPNHCKHGTDTSSFMLLQAYNPDRIGTEVDNPDVEVVMPVSYLMDTGIIYKEDGEYMRNRDWTPELIWEDFENNYDIIGTYDKQIDYGHFKEGDPKGWDDLDRIFTETAESKDEPIVLGRPHLDETEKYYGKNRNPVKLTLDSYDRFIRKIEKMEPISRTYTHAGSKGYRVTISSPHLNMVDCDEIMRTPLENLHTTKVSADHALFCNVTVSEIQDNANGIAPGKEPIVLHMPNQYMAGIPAISRKNGLFLHNGSRKAILFEAEKGDFGNDSFKIVTPGEVLEGVLKEGIESFFDKAGELVFSNQSQQVRMQKKLSKLDFMDGFKDFFNNDGPYKSALRSITSENYVKILKTVNSVHLAIDNSYTDSDGREVKLSRIPDITGSRFYLFDMFNHSDGAKSRTSGVFGRGIEKIEDGYGYGYYYEVKNGKINFDNAVLRSEKELHDKNVSYSPIDKETMEPYLDNDGMMTVINGGEPKYIKQEELDYIAVDPNFSASVARDFPGNPVNETPERSTFHTKNLNGTIIPRNSVKSNIVDSSGKSYAQNAVIEFAPWDGKVIKIEKNPDENDPVKYLSMTIAQNDYPYDTKTLNLRPATAEYGLNVTYQSPCEGLEAGVSFKAGQPLTDANGIKDGKLNIGSFVIYAFTPAASRYTHEDSTGQSNLISYEVTERGEADVNTGASASPYGKDLMFKPNSTVEIPDDDGKMISGARDSKGRLYRIDNLEESGIVKSGSVVNPGDPLIWKAVPDGSVNRTVEEALGQKSVVDGKLPEGYKAEPVIYTGKTPGTVQCYAMPEQNGKTKFVFRIHSTQISQTGDKTNIAGAKGVGVSMAGTMPKMDPDKDDRLSEFEKKMYKEKPGDFLMIYAPGSHFHGFEVCLKDPLGHASRGISTDQCLPYALGVCGKKVDVDPSNKGYIQAARQELENLGEHRDMVYELRGRLNGMNITGNNPLYAEIMVGPMQLVDKIASREMGRGSAEFNQSLNQALVNDKAKAAILGFSKKDPKSERHAETLAFASGTEIDVIDRNTGEMHPLGRKSRKNSDNKTRWHM